MAREQGTGLGVELRVDAELSQSLVLHHEKIPKKLDIFGVF